MNHRFPQLNEAWFRTSKLQKTLEYCISKNGRDISSCFTTFAYASPEFQNVPFYFCPQKASNYSIRITIITSSLTMSDSRFIPQRICHHPLCDHITQDSAITCWFVWVSIYCKLKKGKEHVFPILAFLVLGLREVVHQT